MMKKWIWLAAVLALLLPCMANAETAKDITAACTMNDRAYNAASPAAQVDGNYETYYTGNALTIAAPAGEQIGAILLRWRTISPPTVILKTRQNGQWVEIQRAAPDFAAQYIALTQPVDTLRISGADAALELCEVSVYTPGEPAADVQRWRHPPEKVDMMLFSTHPDDEVLWFGGLLPYYAGEQKKDVLVVNAVYGWYYRRQELLDALWTCGVDIYPVMLGAQDAIENVEEGWKENNRLTQAGLVSIVRQYRPDVVVLHDVNGEYGHAAHKTFCRMGQKAVTMAADAQQCRDSAALYGVWDTPKTYIHLYATRSLRMDWKQPLSAFDGKTGLEVAAEAFQCHVSQRNKHYRVEDGGQYDNALFGLWRTTVGDDTLGNDLFEHIPAR